VDGLADLVRGERGRGGTNDRGPATAAATRTAVSAAAL